MQYGHSVIGNSSSPKEKGKFYKPQTSRGERKCALSIREAGMTHSSSSSHRQTQEGRRSSWGADLPPGDTRRGRAAAVG